MSIASSSTQCMNSNIVVCIWQELEHFAFAVPRSHMGVSCLKLGSNVSLFRHALEDFTIGSCNRVNCKMENYYLVNRTIESSSLANCTIDPKLLSYKLHDTILLSRKLHDRMEVSCKWHDTILLICKLLNGKLLFWKLHDIILLSCNLHDEKT